MATPTPESKGQATRPTRLVAFLEALSSPEQIKIDKPELPKKDDGTL